ncbi:MAG: YeeE/YedE thiosulfate transporter family protein [Peptococcaceae bacterium]
MINVKQQKKKRDQRPLVGIVLAFTIVLFVYFFNINGKLAIYWTLGIAFGFVLEKSRFCFVAALRDPVIAGSTSLLRALILSLAIMTIFFPFIQYSKIAGGALAIPGQVDPIGFHKAAGGFIFGVGMVIAGGCASGTLMRIGEGFLLQGLVLGGFLIGSLGGAWSFPWWEKNFIAGSVTVHLPQLFGWGGAVFLQLVILSVLYHYVKKYDDENNILI